VLSSGALDVPASLEVIDALFASAMYRPDQHTFMLYPAARLPSFLDRNVIPPAAAATLLGPDGQVPGALRRIVGLDPQGQLRFRPGVPNADALDALLDRTGLDEADRSALHDIYEVTFGHASFTGRSGSMYGYEGIGSVYWHMVAKLLLAVQEVYWTALDTGATADQLGRLVDAYRRVRAGLGFCKSPTEFGAIPTDCYSHTPAHAGAQQPGMTGQVKEEILTRFGEIGLRVVDGRVTLSPGLLVPEQVLPVSSGTAHLTYCSVPVAISRGAADTVTVVGSDGTRHETPGRSLTAEHSNELFARSTSIARIEWVLGDDTMQSWAALAPST
jgi:hypothetical protein